MWAGHRTGVSNACGNAQMRVLDCERQCAHRCTPHTSLVPWCGIRVHLTREHRATQRNSPHICTSLCECEVCLGREQHTCVHGCNTQQKRCCECTKAIYMCGRACVSV